MERLDLAVGPFRVFHSPWVAPDRRPARRKNWHQTGIRGFRRRAWREAIPTS